MVEPYMVTFDISSVSIQAYDTGPLLGALIQLNKASHVISESPIRVVPLFFTIPKSF
jgi:hypothetical protein